MADEVPPTTINFRHKSLTALPKDSKPEAPDIKRLRKEVRNNLKSVYSTRGGGANGHTALMMSAADYLQLAGVAFTAPVHPGAAPIHAAGARQAHTILETNQKVQAAIQEFTLYLNMQLLIKNQILEAVPNRYLEILEDNEEEYNNVTIEQMMRHLITTYGSISNADLADNLKELDRDWSTDTELLTIFSHYRKVQLFAADDDPISDKTLLGKATTAIRNAGILNTDLDTFHKWPKVEQTYENFKTDLLVAYKIHKKNLTSAKAGYQSANVVIKTKETDKANDKDHKPNHSSKDLWYCWSHGIMHAHMINPDTAHNSDDCKYPAKGHVKTATIYNMCGGNNYFRRIPDKKAIYQHTTYNDKNRKCKEKTGMPDAKEAKKE